MAGGLDLRSTASAISAADPARRQLALLFMLWTINPLAWGAADEPGLLTGYMFAALLVAPMVAGLCTPPADADERSFDLGLGEFAYALFLAHPIALLVANRIIAPFDDRGWMIFATGLLTTLYLATAFVWLQRHVLDPLPQWLRVRVFAQREPTTVKVPVK
jgi:peptidoglycan/LPS O-acetylase OafA/YrhL